MTEPLQPRELGLKSGEVLGLHSLADELAVEATIRDKDIIVGTETKPVYVKHGFRLTWSEAKTLRNMLNTEIANHESKPCSFSG